jgi:hypothetical protein
MIFRWLSFSTLFFCLICSSAWAHKPSDSYLTVKTTGARIAGQWDIALRDLDFAIGLDDDGSGRLTWAEVKAHNHDIAEFALRRLKIFADARDCPLRATDQLIDQHSDGGYIVLRFAGSCGTAAAKRLTISYSLFFDIDPQHRGLLNLSRDGQASTAVFSPGQSSLTFGTAPTDWRAQFVDYVHEGVWHIWTGYDHILFLLALLLPSVLRRTETGWHPVESFRGAGIAVLKTVTAFTVAHSITLSCAALGVISVPSRLVESTIALSVAIAALNNVYPLFRERTWPVAFLFGLVHGLGFANVLSELGLPRQTLYLALVGFNIGVELGQLAIVATFLPLAFLLRPTPFYSRVLLAGGSACIILLAGAWFVERAFNVNIV